MTIIIAITLVIWVYAVSAISVLMYLTASQIVSKSITSFAWFMESNIFD